SLYAFASLRSPATGGVIPPHTSRCGETPRFLTFHVGPPVEVRRVELRSASLPRAASAKRRTHPPPGPDLPREEARPQPTWSRDVVDQEVAHLGADDEVPADEDQRVRREVHQAVSGELVNPVRPFAEVALHVQDR